MDTNAIDKTAASVGLSTTTVGLVVDTYQGLAAPDTSYLCPYCDKGYKTGRGLKGHLSKHRKGGK